MTACDRPGCTGTIERTGFCDTCGHRPRRSRPGTPEPATPVPVTTGSTGRGGSAVTDPSLLPVFTFPDPSSRILSNPEVPERSRRCHTCDNEAGRGYAGQPALLKGYCEVCENWFSFLPSLHTGDLVAGQYEVKGCFARGGLGWIYLAWDTRLKQDVVLKGLIDVGDALLAEAERLALTMMDHPSIVRIFNFVTHPDPDTGDPRDYIVMEYVDGLVLSELQAWCLRGEEPLGEPLRVEHVITCAVQILAALEYLHDRQMLYCDMKPENAIVRSGQHGERANRIKIIDLGAVRKFGDRTSKMIVTEGYAVDRAEIAERGWTVQADIHTVGVTLDRLFHATIDWRERQGLPSDSSPIAVGLESFERAIKRARDPVADRRFPSAAQMADQLSGVQREIASLRDGIARPEPSALFAPTATLLDAGLGTVPSLDRWLGRFDRIPGVNGDPAEVSESALPDGRPTATAVATGLPVPKVDPSDPAADFLAAAAVPDPGRLLDKLSPTGRDSIELRLARCRAQLEMGDLPGARDSVEVARNLLGGAAGHDWRTRWHEGLLALASDRVDAAKAEFDAVYDALPGEHAPKLALAWCAEHSGNSDRAKLLYTAIWRRDRTQASAAFGLARIRLAGGDRAGAVAVLDEVPKVSRHYDAAAIAGVKVLCGQLSTGSPSPDDLHAAATRLPGLYLDGGEPRGPARDRLTAVVREAALAWAHAKAKPLPVADGDGDVLGAKPDKRRLRELLEHSYHTLARQARDPDTQFVLIDLANLIRPRTRV